MANDGLDALAALHVPDLDRLVEGAGDNEIGLGVEIDAEDEVSVAVEGADAVEVGGSDVPDSY